MLAGFGVMLFFVLSGYFGTRALLQFKSRIEAGRATRGDALKTFYARRYLRIVPVHLLVIGVTVLVNVPYARETWAWNVSFLANVGRLWRDEWFSKFSPLWSLAALEQFYLWWPAAVLWVPRTLLPHLVVATIASASAWRILCLAFSFGPFYWTVVPMATFDFLGLGALLALVRSEPAYAAVLKGLRVAGGWPCGMILVAVVGARVGGLAPLPYEAFWLSIVGSLFFARLIDVSLRGIRSPLGSVLRHPILATSGHVSYSAFLLHNFTELLVPPIGIVGALLQTDGQALVLSRSRSHWRTWCGCTSKCRSRASGRIYTTSGRLAIRSRTRFLRPRDGSRALKACAPPTGRSSACSRPDRRTRSSPSGR